MTNMFSDLGLNDKLIQGLKRKGITSPTEIQKKFIPLSLENKDIIAESETGSGKTLAYLLPLYHKIDPTKREMQAIVLAPTHELAMQIHREIEELSERSDIPVTSVSIIGDVNITRQIDKLKEKPHIIVGSAGRILELIKKKKISAHTIKTIIIDEADRLLDKYNEDTIKAVVKSTLKERQVIAVSATISLDAVTIAHEIMKGPEIVKVEETTKVSSTITHMYFTAELRDKIDILRKLVRLINPERAIVFINRSEEIAVTTEKLKYHNLKVEGIHGTSTKEERQRAMEDFINGKVQLLVASDIAARGLDVKGVTHIFNLDIPEDPKNYLHRAGRTGRAGSTGYAISIVTQRELPILKRYENSFGITISHKDMYGGRIVDPKKNFSKGPAKDHRSNKADITSKISSESRNASDRTDFKRQTPSKTGSSVSKTTIREQIIRSKNK